MYVLYSSVYIKVDPRDAALRASGIPIDSVASAHAHTLTGACQSLTNAPRVMPVYILFNVYTRVCVCVSNVNK